MTPDTAPTTDWQRTQINGALHMTRVEGQGVSVVSMDEMLAALDGAIEDHEARAEADDDDTPLGSHLAAEWRRSAAHLRALAAMLNESERARRAAEKPRAPTTDGVRFPEQGLLDVAQYFADEAKLWQGTAQEPTCRTAEQVIRQAIQARNDELIASREVIADLRGQLGIQQGLISQLQERLKLVDRICHSHHAASLVTWDGECPVCAEAGGVDFYIENAALYRTTPARSAPSTTSEE